MVLTMAACALLGAMALGGTMAYLTDQGSVTNTFTVGQVQIDLTEPDYPGNGTPDVEHLVPNEEVAKNPLVTNTGTNDAVVFMTVEVPRANVTLTADDGTKGTKKIQDLFWLKDTADLPSAHENHFDGGWMELGDKGSVSDTVSRYVFAYRTAVAQGEQTEALFDKVQLKNVIENELTAGATQNVEVRAYAIQAGEILGTDGTNLTDSLTEASLNAIYDIYFRQNADVT
ncbi:MAG: TasA family protein [Eubacteriales bacterium]|nr:TasA family protein [Eubacteriales bacterium]